MDNLVLLSPTCPKCGATHGRGMALTSTSQTRHSGLQVRIGICRCGTRKVYARAPRQPQAPPPAIEVRPYVWRSLGGGARA